MQEKQIIAQELTNRAAELKEGLDNAVKEYKTNILSQSEQDIAKRLLQWQADYQKNNPKASLRNVKRAAKKHFKIK